MQNQGKIQFIKLKITYYILFFFLSIQVPHTVLAENFKGLVYYANEDESSYLKLSMLHQVWLRYTEMNPGSGLYGAPVNQLFDISLRRTRFVVNGKISKKTYFFIQFGQNNFNLNSTKESGAFFHDAVTEYHISKKLQLGAGLTGWSGLLRYSLPSAGTSLALDVPLYQQSTNNISDQLMRKLSVYAKGSLSRLNYTLSVTKPMMIQNALNPTGILSEEMSSFSSKPPNIQYQSYFQYQFFEKESIQNPNSTGTYLGEKKVLAFGVGVIQQKDAMCFLMANSTDTAYHNILLFGTDFFYESKLDSLKKYSLTLYGAYSYFDFGKNYLRNVGVNNPVNTSNLSRIVNGEGNNFPMIGTGHTFYVQLGYLRKLNNKLDSKIQPYIVGQISNYQYLDDFMMMFEGGVNWHIRGSHNEKISLNYQNRPVFATDVATGKNRMTTRKSMVQLQLQLGF